MAGGWSTSPPTPRASDLPENRFTLRARGGIIALTKTLARALARKHITLNAVCPGPTDTPILRGFLGEGEAGQKVYEALVRAIPMKRIGRPEDIAGVVCYLASDEATYITGQVISVSGGLTMAG